MVEVEPSRLDKPTPTNGNVLISEINAWRDELGS
jgi:hypothetical protein